MRDASISEVHLRNFFGGLLRVSEILGAIWSCPRTGWLIWFLALALSILWEVHVPSPGKAISVLAFVAGVMSVRELTTRAKVSWVFLLGLLLTIEFEAIDHDRAEAQKEQTAFFKEQRHGFEAIANQASSNFAATVGGLSAAISGLDATLAVTNRTFQQTRPKAELRLLPIQMNSSTPSLVRAGTKYQFMSYFANSGSSSGKLVKKFGAAYIGKPDDVVTEKILSAAFEEDWLKAPKQERVDALSASPASHFWVFEFPLSEERARQLQTGLTIYVFRRMEYSDELGTWFTDDCAYLDTSSFETSHSFAHPCSVLTNSKYPAKTYK